MIAMSISDTHFLPNLEDVGLIIQHSDLFCYFAQLLCKCRMCWVLEAIVIPVVLVLEDDGETVCETTLLLFFSH